MEKIKVPRKCFTFRDTKMMRVENHVNKKQREECHPSTYRPKPNSATVTYSGPRQYKKKERRVKLQVELQKTTHMPFYEVKYAIM